MGKEKNEEQEFLRYVDRFLNGEEVSPGEDASEETRSTTEFAKKLIELRADPSPEFQERLKSQLLRKLTEKEFAARERARSGWFTGFLDRLIPQSPVWRTAVVTVAIVVAAAGVMWRTGLFTTTVAPGGDAEMAGENDRGLEELAADPTQKDWRQGDIAAVGEEEEEDTLTVPSLGVEDGVYKELVIDIEISASDEIYLRHNLGIVELVTAEYGTEIALTLTYLNNSSETLTIDPIQPEIIIKNLDEELVYTLPAVDGPAALLPSESFQMIYVWEQQYNSGAQVPAGAYRFDLGFIVLTWGTNSEEIPLLSFVVEILEP